MRIFEEWRNWDRETLDKLYSPSKYNKRLPAEEVVLAFCAAVEKGYDVLTELVPVKKDVRYGPTDGQKLDIFNDNPDKGTPIFVYFHGGYWQAMTKKQGCFIVENLIRETNCMVVLVEYDVAPKVTLGEIVNQVQTAAKRIIETAKLHGSSGVYFAGHSAGAHLAAMVAVSPWLQHDIEAQKLIKGYVCISGIFDLKPLVHTYVNDPINMNEEHAVENSPFYQLETISRNAKANSQFLMIVGEYDSPEYIRQSQDFHKALEEVEVKTNYVMIPNVDHFNLVENLVDRDYTLTKEIVKLIKSGNSK